METCSRTSGDSSRSGKPSWAMGLRKRWFCRQVLQKSLQVSQLNRLVQESIQQRLVISPGLFPLIGTDEYRLDNRIQLPHLLDQLLSIQTRKMEIGDDDIKRLVLNHVERALGCHGGRDFIAFS